MVESGFGLAGMRERVELADSRLQVGPRPDGGFPDRELAHHKHITAMSDRLLAPELVEQPVRIIEQLLRRPALDHPAFRKNQNPIRRHDHRQPMSDHDPGRPQNTRTVSDNLLRRVVQRTARLIKEQQTRPADQRLRQHQPLTLPTRQRAAIIRQNSMHPHQQPGDVSRQSDIRISSIVKHLKAAQSPSTAHRTTQ
ncbi:ATP-binding protein [Lentzea tibetensis]|nr:hypothetical protein [Lentzea tibetensis]